MKNSRQHLTASKAAGKFGLVCGSSHPSRSKYDSAVTAEPRTLHLIDAENLLGGAVFTVEQARSLRTTLELTSGYRHGDSVVIASSHMSAGELWIGWGDSARRLVRSGPDGADLVLLDVLRAEQPHKRFDRVVVASGDGIFAADCARLQMLGCDVTVIAADEGSLSNSLRLVTKDVRILGQSAVQPKSSAFAMGAAA